MATEDVWEWWGDQETAWGWTNNSTTIKQMQKFINNWVEYYAPWDRFPSWGTIWQVLTKTETWTEWKDSKWWIQSDTVDWVWAGSESDYESEEKKASNLYFVY